MTTELYLFIFFLVFFMVVLVVRSYLLWKRTGINPLTFGKTDDAHGYNGKLFKFIFVIELLVVSLYAFKQEWYEFLLPFWYLEHVSLQVTGLVLLHISLIWIFTAQLQMADAWRIGIDQQHESPLITKGLFSISRNPIFLGIIVADLGLFLVIPNAFTFLIMVLSINAIQIQVRLEETFLNQRHGEVFSQYRKRVRRWI